MIAYHRLWELSLLESLLLAATVDWRPPVHSGFLPSGCLFTTLLWCKALSLNRLFTSFLLHSQTCNTATQTCGVDYGFYSSTWRDVTWRDFSLRISHTAFPLINTEFSFSISAQIFFEKWNDKWPWQTMFLSTPLSIMALLTRFNTHDTWTTRKLLQ